MTIYVIFIYIYLVTVTPSDSSKAVKLPLSASIHIIQELKKEMISRPDLISHLGWVGLSEGLVGFGSVWSVRFGLDCLDLFHLWFGLIWFSMI